MTVKVFFGGTVLIQSKCLFVNKPSDLGSWTERKPWIVYETIIVIKSVDALAHTEQQAWTFSNPKIYET